MTKQEKHDKDMAIARKVVETIEKSPNITETWVRDEHGGVTVRRINDELTMNGNHVVYKDTVIAMLCSNQTFGSTEPWSMICKAFEKKEEQTKESITNQFLNT